MKKLLILFCLVCFFAPSHAQEAAQLRPPAVPLITHDPYFSVWSTSDTLTAEPTKHWTGSEQPLTGLARIDGTTYRFMGTSPRWAEPPIQAMTQVGFRLTPTRTSYSFEQSGVRLDFTFLTPALPHDLDVLSRPVTYLIWEARATDGKEHQVKLYLDATSYLVVNRVEERAMWSRHRLGDTEVAPGPYAFQEFTVSTSQYSAEYGNSSGGVVNFTIKTGTNDFHGEGYLFLRNEAFNARPDFNRIIGQARPQDRQQEYGFTIGGPVYLPRFGEGGRALYSGRNRTHFFFNYGGYRIDQQENVALSVPTLKMRQGDFSELLTDAEARRFFGTGGVQIFNPYQRPGQREAFAGNVIPQNLLDPVGVAFVNLFPLPNQLGPNGSSVYRNYAATTVASARTNYYVGKVTQIINDKQTLNVSYIYRKLPSQKGGAPRFDAPFVALGRWQQEFQSYYARLQHDWTITPTLLNHFNAGFNRTLVLNRNYSSARNNLSIGPQFDRGRVASDLGVPRGSTQNIGLPIVDIGGYGDAVTSLDPRSYQAGGSTTFDNAKGDNTVQFTDYVTYTRGRQTFKFGGDMRIQQLNVSPRFDVGGNFQFRANQTANTNENTQGWPVASLLVGATSNGFNSLQTIDPAMRLSYPSLFFQDDIRLTPRLTINVGFRFDVNPPRIEARDRYRGFDADVINPARVTVRDASGNLVQLAPINRRGAIVGAAGQGGLEAEHRGLAKTDYSSFGPRLGFAYQLNDKTVLRGGWGLYYNPIAYNDQGEGGFEGYNPGQSNPSPGREALNTIAENGTARTPISLRNFPALPISNPDDQVVGILNRNIEFFDKNFQLGRTAQ